MAKTEASEDTAQDTCALEGFLETIVDVTKAITLRRKSSKPLTACPRLVYRCCSLTEMGSDVSARKRILYFLSVVFLVVLALIAEAAICPSAS